jgi:Fe-S cluster assembly ATP-binding protein
MKNLLEVKNLKASVGKTQILRGVNLSMREGEIYAIFGPNGSGKTSFLKILAGDEAMKVQGGITFQEQDVFGLSMDERVKKGIALAFQHPPAVKGVSLSQMINICRGKKPDEDLDKKSLNLVKEFRLTKFLDRDINVDFSGGERKRADLLQMFFLKPRLLLLDEPDSGVDIESLKLITKELKKYLKENKASALIVTHQGDVLEYLKAQRACVIIDGKNQCYQNPKEVLKIIKEKGYKECLTCKKHVGAGRW